MFKKARDQVSELQLHNTKELNEIVEAITTLQHKYDKLEADYNALAQRTDEAKYEANLTRDRIISIESKIKFWAAILGIGLTVSSGLASLVVDLFAPNEAHEEAIQNKTEIILEQLQELEERLDD